MAARTAIYDGGWKNVSRIAIYDGGWKNVLGGWLYDGGWKQFFLYDSAALVSTTYSAGSTAPANATVGIKYDNDGNVYQYTNSSYGSALYTWKTGPNAASGYTLTMSSTGDALQAPFNVAGPTALSTDCEFRLFNNVSGTPKTATLTLTLKETTFGLTLATATVILVADKQP